MGFLADLLGKYYVDPNASTQPGGMNQLPQSGDGGLSYEGVSVGNDGGLSPPVADPYKQDLATALAIQQGRSTAFNTQIITPSLLSQTQYGCQLELSKINEVVGYEHEGAGNFYNFWRTISIPIIGNFLKIDGATAKMAVAPVKVLGSESDVDQDNTIQPETLYSSSPNILIQFSNNNSPVIVARIGDTFHCPFSQVILTVKIGGPKFTLITGFNASIESNSDNRLLISNPAFGSNRELWNNPTRHSIPWCAGYITPTADADGLTDPSGWQKTGLEAGANTNVGASSTASHDIFVQYLVSQSQGTVPSSYNFNFSKGVGLGWITGIYINIAANYTAQQPALVDPPTPATVTTLEGRVIVSIVRAATSHAAINKTVINIPFLVVGSVYPSFKIEKEFHTPRRFVLCPGDTLRLTVVNNSASGSIKYTWGLEGYAYGRILGGFDINALPDGFWRTKLILEPILDHPFPIDDAQVGGTNP